MVAIKINQFGGLAPRYSSRLIPLTTAVEAVNTKLLSGELRGLRTPKPVVTFSSDVTVRSVYRIPDDPVDLWMKFEAAISNVVHTPVVNDSFERYYWTASLGAPNYNTLARLRSALPPYILGIPRPVAAPHLTASGGGGVVETRAYCYTFVSAFGEEGQPSDPITVTGKIDDTWHLTLMDTTVPNASDRNIVSKHIYRTVTGQASDSFFFVATISLAAANYDDTISDTIVAGGSVMESLFWAGPPSNLQGLCMMANGIMCGFADQSIYFSEPYRPHAWPVSYILGVQFDIVAIRPFGQSLAVLTESNVYIISGVTPSTMTLVDFQATEPCLSPRSAVTFPAGVVYASPNGLAIVTTVGVDLMTSNLVTKEEWERQFDPTTIVAGRYGNQYLAFNQGSEDNAGFLFSPEEEAKLAKLQHIGPIDGLIEDVYSGNVYILRNNTASVWDATGTDPLTYRWRSKELVLDKPSNMGAVQAHYTERVEVIDPGVLASIIEYNTNISLHPLAPLGGAPIAGAHFKGLKIVPAVIAWRTNPLVWRSQPVQWDVSALVPIEPPLYYDQPKAPFGGSAILPTHSIVDQTLTIIVIADGEEIWSDAVNDKEIRRLPSGFKVPVWQVELLGNVDVHQVTIAETAKELANA